MSWWLSPPPAPLPPPPEQSTADLYASLALASVCFVAGSYVLLKIYGVGMVIIKVILAGLLTLASGALACVLMTRRPDESIAAAASRLGDSHVVLSALAWARRWGIGGLGALLDSLWVRQ